MGPNQPNQQMLGVNEKNINMQMLQQVTVQAIKPEGNADLGNQSNPNGFRPGPVDHLNA